MTRIEHDFIGDLEVPANAYYGVQSLRGKENFFITEEKNNQEIYFIIAFAYVKKAAAMANKELGVVKPEVADAMIWACDQLINNTEKYRDQFITDWLQGGAGTSTNMNANEVIAGRANELSGKTRGGKSPVHPNDHVNASQSTNDTYPTAVKMATYFGIQTLLAALAELRGAFEAKAREFANILKIGRTQLQDAVPMTLGQEFHAFAVTLREEIKSIKRCQELLLEVNLGATAIGTGLNTPPEYSGLAIKRLAEITGRAYVPAEDLIEATSDCGAYVMLHGAVKRLAMKLSKICNDLRLLSSGPRTALKEINLPEMQAGSSIITLKRTARTPEIFPGLNIMVAPSSITGKGKAVTVTIGTLVDGTGLASNYTLATPTGVTGTITPKDLSWSGLTADNKEYNGNTSASISGGNISGMIAGETLTSASSAG